MNATMQQFPIDTWPPIIDNQLVTETPLLTIENANYTSSTFILFYQSLFTPDNLQTKLINELARIVK